MKAISSDLRMDRGCLADEECKSKIHGLSRGQTGGASKRHFPAIENLLFNKCSLFIMILEESTQEVKALNKEKVMRQS